MRSKQTFSISHASDAYLTSPGRNTHQTRMSLSVQMCRYPQHVRLRWLGHVWRVCVFQKISSMVSLPLVQGASAAQLCGSWMLANEVSNLLRSASSHDNLLGQIATTGYRQNKEDTNCGWRRENVGEKGHRLPRIYIKA